MEKKALKTKKEIEECIEKICMETGRNYSRLYVGYAEKETNKRFVQRLTDAYMKDYDYVIKYCYCYDLFLIWKSRGRGFTCYNVGAKDVFDAIDCDGRYVVKNKEYPNRGKEKVIVAKGDKIREAIQSL